MMPLRGGADRRFVIAILLCGSFLRLRQFLAARPLWLDEAMLSLNVLTRSFAGLLRPLDQDQTAPVPFLWAQKFLTLIGGPHELVFRIVSLVAGVAFLMVLGRLAARLLPTGPALLALLLAALSPALIQYSNEAKPYGLDALLAALLLLLTLRLLEQPDAATRWWVLGLTGALIATASAPAPFTLAGALVALMIAPQVRARPGVWRRIAVMGLGWAAVLGVVYLAVYRAPANSAYMQRYWIPSFIGPVGPGMGARIQTIISITAQELLMALGGTWRDRAALLWLLPLALGAVRVLRVRGGTMAALLLIPPASTVAASVLQQYPIATRLVLFLAAPLLLVLAEGMAELADYANRVVKAPWLPMMGLAALVLPGLEAVRQFVAPDRKDDLAPLIEQFKAEHEARAAVYVSARAVPVWLYYTTDWQHSPDTARINRLGRLVSSEGRAFRHAPTRGHPVVAEGDDLIFDYRDWSELVGVPTGQGPNQFGVLTSRPDTGWARNEVRRLEAAGRTDNWMVLTSFAPSVPPALKEAVERGGGRFTLWNERQGALLARIQF